MTSSSSREREHRFGLYLAALVEEAKKGQTLG